MQDDVVALFAYDRWANTKVLDACRKLTAEQYVAEPVPGWSSVRSTIYHNQARQHPDRQERHTVDRRFRFGAAGGECRKRAKVCRNSQLHEPRAGSR